MLMNNLIDIYHGSPNVIEQPVFGEGKFHNDSYFSYAGDFVNGTLSLSDLSEAMRLGKLGEQVVLKSKKPFEALTFVEAIEAPRQEYFAKYRQRDEEARGRYRQIASKPMAENKIYVIDIIRNNWNNGQSI
ncbi:MAG: DUF3990 domain-containing protein [Bacteroidales bacterium]|nr:DUF3990 domain-containing protein [Bacteroidales bacterium]